MSETPRTDAKEAETERPVHTLRMLEVHSHYGWKFARTLERELAAVTRERDEAQQELKHLQGRHAVLGRSYDEAADRVRPLHAEVDRLEDERDDLRAEVERLRALIAETLALNSLRQDLDCWRFRDGSEDGVDLDAKTVVPHEEAYERRRMKWLKEMHAALTPAEETK